MTLLSHTIFRSTCIYRALSSITCKVGLSVITLPDLPWLGRFSFKMFAHMLYGKNDLHAPYRKTECWSTSISSPLQPWRIGRPSQLCMCPNSSNPLLCRDRWTSTRVMGEGSFGHRRSNRAWYRGWHNLISVITVHGRNRKQKASFCTILILKASIRKPATRILNCRIVLTV